MFSVLPKIGIVSLLIPVSRGEKKWNFGNIIYAYIAITGRMKRIDWNCRHTDPGWSTCGLLSG